MVQVTWTLGREITAGSSCHQTYLGDRVMEKNSLQDRSGLEDKCSPLLHPWGLGVRSSPCSRSQPHRDLTGLRALQLHSTNLMQEAEARPSLQRHENQTATASHCNCQLILAKEYIHTKKPTQPKKLAQEERLFSYLECREVEEMNQQDKRFLLGTTQEIQKPELPCLLMERT